MIAHVWVDTLDTGRSQLRKVRRAGDQPDFSQAINKGFDPRLEGSGACAKGDA